MGAAVSHSWLPQAPSFINSGFGIAVCSTNGQDDLDHR